MERAGPIKGQMGLRHCATSTGFPLITSHSRTIVTAMHYPGGARKRLSAAAHSDGGK